MREKLRHRNEVRLAGEHLHAIDRFQVEHYHRAPVIVETGFTLDYGVEGQKRFCSVVFYIDTGMSYVFRGDPERSVFFDGRLVAIVCEPYSKHGLIYGVHIGPFIVVKKAHPLLRRCAIVGRVQGQPDCVFMILSSKTSNKSQRPNLLSLSRM